ncbi:hypothetical protein IL306_008867 [Fusarium sp. DS 682]|nr:hypothetical protein IL306_008867 [Fusarium sp. DS 682]
MSFHSNTQSKDLSTHDNQDDYLVSLEHYGLQRQSAAQKLTPLDMNLSRLYGIRLILCFPLASDADHLQVYANLKKGLAHTVASVPWISGIIGPEEGEDPKFRKVQVLNSPNGFVFPYVSCLLFV